LAAQHILTQFQDFLNWLIAIAVLAVAAVFIAIGVMWYRAGNMRWHIAQFSKTKLRWQRCTACDGCGVLYKDPTTGAYGAIPKSIRINAVRGGFFKPPLANTVRCGPPYTSRGCNGMGRHAVRRVESWPG